MNKKKFISKINPLFLKGIAHRGLHNDKFTENGLNAFKNALEHNVAIELDVHLTKDNDLIVCHDEDLFRTTGKHGIIEELTVKEIKDNFKLLDGGEVPTFDEVLDLINEQVPIVTELKVYKKNHKPLAALTLKKLERIKDKKNIILISFDPRALAKTKHHGFVNSLLVVKNHEPDYEWIYHLRFLFDSVDLEDVMLEQKRVQRYQKRHFVNAWTIQTPEQLEKVKDFADTVTFQFLEPDKVKEALK